MHLVILVRVDITTIMGYAKQIMQFAKAEIHLCNVVIGAELNMAPELLATLARFLPINAPVILMQAYVYLMVTMQIALVATGKLCQEL